MPEETYVVTKSVSEKVAEMRLPTFSKQVVIELTERCNNNCVHCYVNRPERDALAQKNEMTTAEVKRVLTETAALGFYQITFTGGEPLLRDDFEELYVFARKIGLKVSIFTNATLITERLTRLWASIPPLVEIEVTVYGMTRLSCEKVTRTMGSFEAAQKGIDLLLQYNIPFIAKGVLGFWDISEIKAFEDWGATLPWAKRSQMNSVLFELRVRRDETKNSKIRRWRVPPGEVVRWLARDTDAYRQGMKRFCPKFMRPRGDKLVVCDAGCGGYVNAYGKFFPCIFLRHPSFEVDVKEGTLKEALGYVFPKLREKRATNPEYLKRCARCFLMGLCEQCPGKSWTEHGALDTPGEYYCQVAHAQARFLGLIQEHENAWEVESWEHRISTFINS